MIKTIQYTLCAVLVVTGCYLAGGYEVQHSGSSTQKQEKSTLLESYDYVQSHGSVTRVEKRLVETVDPDYDKKYPKKH